MGGPRSVRGGAHADPTDAGHGDGGGDDGGGGGSDVLAGSSQEE